MPNPTENSRIAEFKDFSRLLDDFPVIFMTVSFSRTFQESSLNSSTFQACVNPVVLTCLNMFLVGRSLWNGCPQDNIAQLDNS